MAISWCKFFKAENPRRKVRSSLKGAGPKGDSTAQRRRLGGKGLPKDEKKLPKKGLKKRGTLPKAETGSLRKVFFLPAHILWKST